MKKNTFTGIIIALTLIIGCISCAKFEPATCEMTDCYAEGKMLHGSAAVTDGGGCEYFVEQGFCYSLYDTLAATDVYTTMVPVAYSTDSVKFSWDYELPLADTTYYVCAYVKNNAGLAYSEKEQVSTSAASDTTAH